MILHGFALSSASYRVRIALNLKGLAYETRSYRLRVGEQRTPDYLARNPAGLVPTLEIEGLHLSQSLAIIDYLDATVPDPRLVPADAVARARVLEVALTIACDIHPLNNLRTLDYLGTRFGQDAAAVDGWYAHWISLGFATLEVLLARAPAAPFACGERPSLADICLVPQMYNARRYDVDLSPYPRVVEVADRAAALPAFAAAAPAA